jgi:hypothetical protein
MSLNMLSTGKQGIQGGIDGTVASEFDWHVNPLGGDEIKRR